MIERDELCRRIPHSGSMCLLNRVLKWDSKGIVCEAVSHRDKGNPLSCDQWQYMEACSLKMMK